MGLDKSLNQNLQGDLEKISYMNSDGPPGNFCKVPNKHLIRRVLEGQNRGSTNMSIFGKDHECRECELK